LLKKIHRRKTVKRNMKEEEEDEKSPKHESTTNSPQQPNVELNASRGGGGGSNYSVDENSYKGLLHAVLKLQQQNEMSQLALKQVLEELAFVRKSHYELSEKVQQLSVTGANNTNNTNNIHNSNGFNFAPPSFNSSSSFSSTSNPYGFLPIPAISGPPPSYAPNNQSSSQQNGNVNYNMYTPSPNDLSSILFSEDGSSSLNGSANGTTRSLLNIMQQSNNSISLLPSSTTSDKPTFDFNNLQQQLIEQESSDAHASNHSHRNGIPISMYETSNHFDVFS